MQIIEKYSGPRTTCFLDPGETSATETGGEKGGQKKDRPKLAYHYFSRSECWYARFWFEKYGYARFRLEKKSTGIVHTTIFVESGKAYFVRTTIFVESGKA